MERQRQEDRKDESEGQSDRKEKEEKREAGIQKVWEDCVEDTRPAGRKTRVVDSTVCDRVPRCEVRLLLA